MTINTENGIDSWLVVPTLGCIDQTASQFAFVAPTTQGPNLLTDYENQGISIQNPGVNFLGGIGCTIELELAYYVAGLPQTL